jgi:hypothetical protein
VIVRLELHFGAGANTMKATGYFTVAAMTLLVVNSANAQGRGRGRGDDKDRDPHAQQVPQAEQQRRIAEEQQRQRDYQNRLNAQIQAAQQQQARLQAQNRANEIAAHQQYLEGLRRQQAQLQTQRDYARDPYVSAPVTYRYRLNGAYHQTNQYGVDVLRQAVNDGYAQCYQQGRADRADGQTSNYRRSFAYQDANYGYNGQYVPQSDYNYYFRQGCQRGYSDGYANQSRYGNFSNGTGSILGNILSGILGLSSIR